MRSAGTAWWCGALVTAGCFTGGFLTGQPCAGDGDCGPQLQCLQGVCGGPQANTGTGEPGSSGTTGAAPTTGSTTADPSEGPGEATSSETTSTTTSDDASSSSTGMTTGPDPCATASCRQLDLLFVVDDSPSMAQWQPELLTSLLAFATGPTGELLRDSCDVHLGVLSTGAPYLDNPDGCRDLGALVRVGAGDCGGAFATESDDLAEALACRLDVGSAGAHDERPVGALLSALTPAHNGPGGCNEGFLREQSLLVVVFATDEDDDADPEDELAGAETPGTPQAWFDAVVAFKGSAELVVMVGLTGDLEAMTRCPWLPDVDDGTGAEAPDRLRQFIDLFPRRATTTLCQGDYEGFVADQVSAALASGCEAHAQVTP